MRKRLSLLMAVVMLFAVIANLFACTFEMRDPLNPTGKPNQGEATTIGDIYVENVRPNDTEKAPSYSAPEVSPPDEPVPVAVYMVSFMLEGSEYQPEPQMVMEGEYVQKPDITFDTDARFDGIWYLDPSCGKEYQYDFNTPVYEDLILYGRVEIAYTVSFVIEGNTDQPELQKVWSGERVKYPKFVLDEYCTFDGLWYLDPSYETAYRYDFNAPVTEDLVLYAKVTRDPAAPVLVIDPAFINDQALSTANPAVSNHVGSAEVITEGAYTFVRLTANGGDPYLAVVPIGATQTLPQFMAISYRTNADTVDGQFFMGSGQGWTGAGDTFEVNWNEDEAWNFMVIDLTAVEGLTAITDGLINYARFDFFTGASEDGDYIDIEYIAFFNTAEYAQVYDFELHKAPGWSDSGIITHQSFDELDKYSAGAKVEGVFTPGQSATWDLTLTLSDFSVDALRYWGWVGVKGEVGQFGYQINYGAPVYDDAWTVEAGQDVINVAVGLGADNASRMEIMIPLAGLEGTNTVRAMYKSADGAEVILNEFTVNLPEKPKDITNTFVSDLASNAADTTIDATDLKNGFTFFLNLGDYKTSATSYKLNGISEMFTDVNGKYALTVNFAEGRTGNYYAFARGVHAVETNGTVDYTIKNFYETDGSASDMGGAGIYACIQDNELKIMIKLYDGESETRIKNAYYTLPCEGTTLTLADDGNTVYILVNGVTYATVTMSGEIEYDGFANVSPATTFAKTAVVALKDGTTETLENTLIDSTCDTQTGMVVRTVAVHFDSIKLESFSAVEIPEMVLPAPAPEMPAEFTLSLVQGNLEGKTLYFNGAMDGNFLAVSENAEDAVVMYSEAVEDGYRMYFLDGETKKYVEIYDRGEGKAGVQIVDEATMAYVWNADANTWTVTYGENTFYLGTYNTYNNISSSNISYITGDNAADVGVNQFVLTWNAIEAAE